MVVLGLGGEGSFLETSVTFLQAFQRVYALTHQLNKYLFNTYYLYCISKGIKGILLLFQLHQDKIEKIVGYLMCTW